MSIEALMSAADAAGYVMATQDELPDDFGTEPAVLEFKQQPSTSLAIWRPVVPSVDGKPVEQTSLNAMWEWFSGRFVTGATA